MSGLDGFFRRLVLDRLRGLDHGRLTILEDGQVHAFGRPQSEPAATLRILDPSVWRQAALGGSIGAGEAYALGHWESDDLAEVARIFCGDRDLNLGMERGLARVGGAIARWLHTFRRNHRKGSRRNISAHYDVGNDFFERVLDESMTYSSGVYEHANASLAEAQSHKYDKICRKLRIRPEDHVLEIGTGWGGFAIHAAQRYGCRVTTTTISRQQYELAVERVRAAGLESRIEILFEDYRDLEGQYDKLVSIEMIEAVGHSFYNDFFRACGERVRPNGLMLLQAITVPDREYDRCRRSVDFIKKHIFPGCCIPSVQVMQNAVAETSEMRFLDLEDITPHYARTLREWRENMDAHLDEIRGRNYSEEFLRLWRFYFAYCEGGFTERAISVGQLLWAGPQWRSDPVDASRLTGETAGAISSTAGGST